MGGEGGVAPTHHPPLLKPGVAAYRLYLTYPLTDRRARTKDACMNPARATAQFTSSHSLSLHLVASQ